MFDDIFEILKNFFESCWGLFLTVSMQRPVIESSASQPVSCLPCIEDIGPNVHGEGVQKHFLALHLFGILVKYMVTPVLSPLGY